MPIFPGLVTHNNPNEAIIDVTGNQVKGFGVFATISGTAPNRDSLSASVRSEGFIAVVTGLDKAYIYTSSSIANTDWQNAANWTEIGSGSGSYTLPIATASALGGIRVGTNLSIDAGTGILSATDTNTTYAAGNGLTLTGTSFSHTDTSSQPSSNNTGRTYIQSIGLDTYGHVTSLSTATETVTSNTYTAGNGLTLTGNDFNVGGTTNRINVGTDAIDIASTYVGQASITTLGTITTGTWNGASISSDYITSVAGTKVTGNITGNAANVTGTVAIGNGGTGATTAPSARTNLGATTVGSNLFTLTNPSAITFPRINADNTVSALSAADFRTAISAGTGNGTVTSVGISVPTGLSVSNTPVTGSGTIAIALTAGYSIPTTASQNNWDTAFTDRLKWDGGSVGLNTATARTSLGLVINTDVQAYDADLAAIAALTGTTGLLRKTASDTWSLDTAAYLSGTVPISSGGTGATTVGNARINLLPTYSGNNNKALRVNSAGSDVEWSCISKDMFCVPGTLPSTTSHIVTSVYRDGQWRDIEVNGLYSPSGTITVANDSVVVKSINSITPTAGAVTIYGSSIQRTSTNSQTISSGITSLEGSVSAVQFDITNIYEAISPITKVVNKTRFGFSGTSAALETTETSGSFFRGSTGYFFTQASPGVTEIKVLDDSATPVQRTILYGIGRVNGAQVGIHNTSPAYPFDITGNTRVTGNIIVTGTVDGVDISELKNTVDNITVGGTEEIELFSYFIS
jgi:hypothetical protein